MALCLIKDVVKEDWAPADGDVVRLPVRAGEPVLIVQHDATLPDGSASGRGVIPLHRSGSLQQARKPLQLAAVSPENPPPRVLGQDTAFRFEALQPGMLVEANVAGLLADGLRLVFCGYFDGTAACEALGVATAACARRHRIHSAGRKRNRSPHPCARV